MPYVIVRSREGSNTPRDVSVSGLSKEEIDKMDIKPIKLISTWYDGVLYNSFPYVILNALEKLGYRVVATTTDSKDVEHWTLRKEFN